MLGFHFLSDERTIAIGMGGGIPMAIPLNSMVTYYKIFQPRVNLKYFVRVVRAADIEYINLCSNKKSKGSDKKSPQRAHSNGLPVRPKES